MLNTPEDVGPPWEAAFSADRPSVIGVLTEPDACPLPPHITVEQALYLTESQLHADSAIDGMIGESALQVLAALIAGVETKSGSMWAQQHPAIHPSREGVQHEQRTSFQRLRQS